MSPRRPAKTAALVGLAFAAAAALLIGSIGFFDRTMLFNDEIINAYKAQQHRVFDYAARPAYYGANVLAVELLGDDPRSLAALSLLFFVVTAVLLHACGRRIAGSAAGALSALLFVLSPLVYAIGLRGMPHLPAGTATLVPVLVLLHALDRPTARGRERWAFVSGALASATLAFHPILVTFVAAFTSLAALAAVWPRPPAAVAAWIDPRRRSAVAVLLGVAAGGLLLELTCLLVGGRSYVGDMLDGAARVGVERDPRGYAVFLLFYARVLAAAQPSGLALAAAALAVVSWAGLTRRRAPDGPALAGTIVAAWLFAGSFFGTPLAQIRGERVFVTYVPLACLLFGCTIALGLGALPAGGGRRARAVAAAVIVAVVAAGLPGLGAAVAEVRDEREREALRGDATLSWFYETIRALDTDRVGFVGLVRQNGPARRMTVLGGKRFVRLGGVVPAAAGRRRFERFRRRLVDERIAHLIVDVPDDEAERVRLTLRRLGGDHLATWQSSRQLWRLDLLDARPFLAHWPLDGDETLRDEGPFSLHGAWDGEPARRIAGARGGALAFTAGTGVAALRSPGRLHPGGRFGIELLVRREATGGGARQIVVAKEGVLTIALDRGRPAVRPGGGTDGPWRIAKAPLEPGRWHRLRVTLAGGHLCVAVDGRTVLAGRRAGRPRSLAAPLVVGGPGFVGSLDEVRLLSVPAPPTGRPREQPACSPGAG